MKTQLTTTVESLLQELLSSYPFDGPSKDAFKSSVEEIRQRLQEAGVDLLTPQQIQHPSEAFQVQALKDMIFGKAGMVASFEETRDRLQVRLNHSRKQEEPLLGLASTGQLLDELGARIELNLHRALRDAATTRLGELSAELIKAGHSMDYKPASQEPDTKHPAMVESPTTAELSQPKAPLEASASILLGMAKESKAASMTGTPAGDIASTSFLRGVKVGSDLALSGALLPEILERLSKELEIHLTPGSLA